MIMERVGDDFSRKGKGRKGNSNEAQQKQQKPQWRYMVKKGRITPYKIQPRYSDFLFTMDRETDKKTHR